MYNDIVSRIGFNKIGTNQGFKLKWALDPWSCYSLVIEPVRGSRSMWPKRKTQVEKYACYENGSAKVYGSETYSTIIEMTIGLWNFGNSFLPQMRGSGLVLKFSLIVQRANYRLRDYFHPLLKLVTWLAHVVQAMSIAVVVATTISQGNLGKYTVFSNHRVMHASFRRVTCVHHREMQDAGHQSDEVRPNWSIGLRSGRNPRWKSWMMDSSGGSTARSQSRTAQILGTLCIVFGVLCSIHWSYTRKS